MSGFWKHYAQVNDDIRTELIDKAWFDKRVGSNAMESDVEHMAQRSKAADQGLETQDQNMQAFYGGPDAEAHDDPDQTQVDAAEALYGAEQTQAQGASLYGYDALEDEQEDQEQTQRL